MDNLWNQKTLNYEESGRFTEDDYRDAVAKKRKVVVADVLFVQDLQSLKIETSSIKTDILTTSTLSSAKQFIKNTVPISMSYTQADAIDTSPLPIKAYKDGDLNETVKDLATQVSELESKLNNEIVERKGGDDLLNIKIESLSARTKALEDSDEILKVEIDAMKVDIDLINITIADLQDQITKISTDDVASLAARVDELENDLKDETSERIINDSKLQVEIDANTNNLVSLTDLVTSVQTDLALETSTRILEDDLIIKRIDDVDLNIDELENNLKDEISERIINDNKLQVEIDANTNNLVSLTNLVASVQTDLALETSTRISEDDVITKRIDDVDLNIAILDAATLKLTDDVERLTLEIEDINETDADLQDQIDELAVRVTELEGLIPPENKYSLWVNRAGGKYIEAITDPRFTNDWRTNPNQFTVPGRANNPNNVITMSTMFSFSHLGGGVKYDIQAATYSATCYYPEIEKPDPVVRVNYKAAVYRSGGAKYYEGPYWMVLPLTDQKDPFTVTISFPDLSLDVIDGVFVWCIYFQNLSTKDFVGSVTDANDVVRLVSSDK